MSRHYIVMKTSEWERLRRQGSPAVMGPCVDEIRRVRDREALGEISEQWKRTWPDSDEGIMIRALKRMEQKKLKQKAEVKAYQEKLKRTSTHETEQAVAKARQMIFNDSSYGMELKSALLESMALEERDLHLKLKNEMKERATEHERELELMYAQMRLEEDKIRDEKERKKKHQLYEIDEVNKALSNKKQQEMEKEKMEEIESRLENKQFTKILLEYEEKEENKFTKLQKQAIQEHLADQIEVQQNHKKREEIDEALAYVWRKYHDLVRCGEEKKFQQIHKERYNTEHSKQNYELLKSIQDNEKKSYDEFIQKGINRAEEMAHMKDAKKAKEHKIKTEKRYAHAKEQREASEKGHFKAEAWLDRSKCVCLKQSLFTKEATDYEKKRQEAKIAIPNPDKQQLDPCLSFLVPQNRLVLALKQREKVPSPWSGTKAAHEQFITQADDVIRQCRYKTTARRVVQNYKKNNRLDLNIPASL